MPQSRLFRVILITCILILISYRQCQANWESMSGLCERSGPRGLHLEPYDIYNQICCAGKIQNREKGRLCCDNKELYFKKDSICCNGIITPREEREQICCGKNLIYKDEAFCCRNNAVFLTETQRESTTYLRCCGNNTVIDLKESFCCDNKPREKDDVHSCCRTEVFDTNINKCVQGRVIPKDKEFCGKLLYSPLTSMCCNGVFHDKIPEKDPSRPREPNPHFGCCDKIIMNITSEKCCLEKFTQYKSHTISNGKDIECCGEGFYNTSSQVCINGKPETKKHDWIMCGQDYINSNEMKCCENYLPYNPVHQECCPGNAPCIIGKGKACCNGHQMDESKEICCGLEPCTKKKGDDDQCCYSPYTRTYETFNSKGNEFCIDGTVRKAPKGLEPCGSSGYFHPETEFCCGDHVYRYDQFSGCCYNKPYNEQKNLCCAGYLSELSPKEGRCCSYRAFSIDDNSNPCMPLCSKKGSRRGKRFNSTTELCCDGTIYTKAQGMTCCGRKLINTLNRKCCADRFSYKLNGNKRCCNDVETYHQKRQKCVNGKVEPRLKQFDTERLCNTKMIKHFDFVLQHACLRKYGITGRISKVKNMPQKLSLKLEDVKGLKRTEDFKRWRGPKSLTFHIHGTHKCRKMYLPVGQDVIIFFDADSRHGKKVTLSQKAKFTITKMTRFRLRSVTSDLSIDYCKKLT